MQLNLEKIVTHSPREVFICPEESRFYSQCLEKMFLTYCYSTDSIVEFGSGDGRPVIDSLLKTQFKGSIDSYELNSTACQIAQSNIYECNLSRQYTVHNQCFFEGLQRSKANYLIANPPYLPAPDQNIRMPALHGGSDGAAIASLSQLQMKALARQGFQPSFVRGSFRIAISLINCYPKVVSMF